MTTTPLPQWSKLPTGSNPTSRTIFWINTLDDEILRNVHNATTPRGQLNSYFSPPAPTFDAAGIEIEVDPNANILDDVQIPELPPPTASPVDLTRHGHALQHYQIRKALYNAQQLAINHIKEQLIQCIDPTTMSIVFPDPSTLHDMTAPNIYDLLWKYFNKPSRALIEPIYAALQIPFIYCDPNSYANHLAMTMDNQRVLTYLLMGMNEPDKCEKFRETLTSSSDAAFFQPFLDHYDVTHDALSAQSLEDMMRCCSAVALI